MRSFYLKSHSLLVLLTIISLIGCETKTTETINLEEATWSMQDITTSASFRGLSVVSDQVVWASGSEGTYIKTTDGGATWSVDSVSGATDLELRDIEAFDEFIAYAMSVGEGKKSRIYKTTDGGKNWTLQFTNPHPQGFLDGIAFWDINNGLAYGDPVDGHCFILKTTDGGKNWNRISIENIPPAKEGEYGFAASGTGITVFGSNHAWICTGGSAARVLRSIDKGQTWTISDTPVISGETSTGIFGLAFRDENYGITVGGDYQKPNQIDRNFAISTDGGVTWKLADLAPTIGFKSAVTYLPGSNPPSWLTLGTSGTDYSLDNGLTWTQMDTTSFNSVAFSPSGATGWAAGIRGKIAKLISLKQ